jgi:hypothetical protein
MPFVAIIFLEGTAKRHVRATLRGGYLSSNQSIIFTDFIPLPLQSVEE